MVLVANVESFGFAILRQVPYLRVIFERRTTSFPYLIAGFRHTEYSDPAARFSLVLRGRLQAQSRE
jgi:hypothetical protein